LAMLNTERLNLRVRFAYFIKAHLDQLYYGFNHRRGHVLCNKRIRPAGR